MIYTSYFAAMRKMTPEQQAKCMSIARFTPKGVNIPINTMLVPHWDILKKYKEDKDTDSFTTAYSKQLEALNPHTIADTMNGRILLCYEKSEDFCHRHILVKWFRKNGYKCEELEL